MATTKFTLKIPSIGYKNTIELKVSTLPKVIVVFYHGGPNGNGKIKTDTSMKSSGYTGSAYDRTIEYIKGKGLKVESALIAPAAIQYFGVKTGSEFIRKHYNKGDKVIIYGYSYGGDNAVNLAEDIDDITVDLLITVDSSDGPGRGLTVDTSIPDNVTLAYNFYQTSASGTSSSSHKSSSSSNSDSSTSDSDNPHSSENSSSDGSSNSVGSRGFPHTSEGKAEVHNIRLTADKITHGNIQNLGEYDIQRRVNDRIDTYIN